MTTMITPRKLAAFTANTQPEPAWAIKTPAAAGPNAAARFIEIELSDDAAKSCSRPTSSGVIAIQLGMLSVPPMLRSTDSANKPLVVMRFVSVATANNAAATSMRVCATIKIFRRSTTSASAPAGSANRNDGNALADCSKAIVAADGDKLVMSHAAPTVCMADPMLETRAASHNQRNILIRRGAQVLTDVRAADTAADVVMTPHGRKPQSSGRTQPPWGEPAAN